MAVEAFIFDIGNVLVRFEAGLAERNLARLGAPSSEALLREIGALGLPYERGELDRGAFLARLRGLLDHAGPEEDLVRAWQEIFSPNEPMWDLVENLHGRFPLYLLSNTNCIHHDHLAREYPVLRRFRDGVFSYRAGLCKPEAAIFELAARQFGVAPGNTVYIDDLPANVEAAARAGFVAIRYEVDNHADLPAALRSLGVQSV